MKSKTHLRRERELRGWSQAKVAQEIGTTPNTVSLWERGKNSPSPYFREQLCLLFGKNAAELGLLEDAPPVDSAASSPAPSQKTPTSSANTSIAGLYDPTVPFLSPTRLLGRSNEQQQIKHLLKNGRYGTFIGLSGLPGVGKTALAAEIAHDEAVRAQFSDGVLWAGLGPTPHILGHLSRWSTLLGLATAEMSAYQSGENWSQAIRMAIGTRHLLLVIDDVWEMESALPLLVGGPNCAHLITTRFPQIAIRLAGDGTLAIRELDEQQSFSLLEQLVPDIAQHEPEALQSLIRSVGGLPLALTLMGKYLSIYTQSGQPRRVRTTLEQLRHAEQRLRLSEPQALLNQFAHMSAGRSISLEAVIGLSDQQLSDQARQTLYALSVFPPKPNSFSEEAALAICNLPVETLDALIDAGLLESSGPGRYTLHHTISDYARTHLQDTEPSSRLIHYFVDFIEAHLRDYDLLEIESHNIFAALDAASAQGRAAELVRGARTFVTYLKMRGFYTLANKYLQEAYDAAIVSEDTAGLAHILLHLGQIAEMQGKTEEAEAYLQEGLRLARQVHDSERTGHLLRILGQIVEQKRNYTQAEQYYQEGLALAQQVGNQEQVGNFFVSLGVLELHRGNINQAEAYLQQGLVVVRATAPLDQLSFTLRKLGTVAEARGEYTRAEHYYLEGLELARQIGYREQISGLLTNLGVVVYQRGDYAQAEAYWKEGLAVARQIGHRELISLLLANLGDVLTEQQQYSQAHSYLQEGLALAREMEHHEVVCQLLGNIAMLASKDQAYAQADAALEEALALAQHIGARKLISSTLSIQGEIQLQRHRYDDASDTFTEMLALNRNTEEKEMTALALYGLARISALQGNYSEAHKQGEQSLLLLNEIGHHSAHEVKNWLRTLSPRDLSQEHLNSA